jgi:drug/metabolite transporter (DMT)-like permease
MTLNPGSAPALVAALFFGASTPLARALVGAMDPAWLAGCLYAGSGIGLAIVLAFRRAAKRLRRAAPLSRRDLPWLAATIVSGGIVAPLLFTFGLRDTPGATASLLLNLETVLTVALARFAFREHYGARVMIGMTLIVVACALLGWDGRSLGSGRGAPLIALACLGWALDNNLTRKIAGSDAVAIATAKGLCGGAVNLALAAALGGPPPELPQALGAGAVGLLGYGLSLVLFIVSMRELGTARASAYFAIAPFFGVAIAFALLAEPVQSAFWIALPLMAAGVWLHLTERHEHLHTHEAMTHDHMHRHDGHHRHAHDFPWDGTEPHAHPHVHAPLTHAHAHAPDLHHWHEHR